MISSELQAADEGEIEILKQTIQQQQQVIDKQQLKLEEVFRKMAVLEARLDAQAPPLDAAPRRVDLNSDEAESFPDSSPANNVLERPWYRNIRVDGFGGAGFVWTEGGARNEQGNFLNYEATVNLEAEVWENISYFHELQTVRLGDETTKFLRTGEVYVHFKDLLRTLFGWEGNYLGLKLGRMDIPVGEDYLFQDVIDNPLITLSAAYPYGWDEGLVLYGKLHGINWVGAVMDGTDDRAFEDDSEKFLSFKIYGNPTEHLYLSASGFRNGRASKSAWEFGGSHFEPLGTGATSSLGSSSASAVNAYSYEFDARYNFGYERYLGLQYGAAFVSDSGNFDRTIHYVKVEPKWDLGAAFNHKLYIVGRLSTIGTFDDEGYSFDGKPFAGGKSKFGYDLSSLVRWALGIGYWFNPHTLVKIEYSRDEFHLIEQSRLVRSGDGRNFLGVVTALKFG